jgi:hypothetical protein
MDAPTGWLIWSSEHRAWWRAGGHGYTSKRSAAGIYTMQEAIDICLPPHFRGVGEHTDISVPPETMIPADLSTVTLG